MKTHVKWSQILFFALLYFLQGAAFAYVVNFQKPYLAAQGISKETLGLFTSLLLIPFIAKIFLGMLSDRVPLGRQGSRKPYMLIGLTMFMICYLVLTQISPSSNFVMFAAFTWTASLGLALFDTCADGWAVDAVEDSQQSVVQGAMVSGRSLGLIGMSGTFGLLSSHFGYSAIFVSLAVLALLVSVMVLLQPYQKLEPNPHSKPGNWSELWSRGYLLFAVFGILYSISSFGTDGLLTLHLSETRGAGPTEIGHFGVFRGIGALIGAGAFAVMAYRRPLRRMMVLALTLLGAGCLLPLSGTDVLLAAGLWGAVWGFQETAYVTLAMRWARGAWAATFFAISMIFSNVGTSLGEALAAPLVPQIGYAGVFISFALLAWISIPFVFRATR